MNDSTMRPAWMDDELVKDISQEKLAFLEDLFREGHGKSQKEMLAFVIPMMKKAKQQNLTFTQSEMNAAITAIKKYSSKEELNKINQLLGKVKNNTGGGN